MEDYIEELIDRLGSSYDLVVAAAKRAKQLRAGAKPLVDTDAKNPLTIALQEIAQGSIILKPLEESNTEEAGKSQESSYLERRGDIAEIMDRNEREDDKEQEEET